MQGDDQEPLVALSYWQELTESEFLQRGFPALPEARKGLVGRLHDRTPLASTVQIYATVRLMISQKVASNRFGARQPKYNPCFFDVSHVVTCHFVPCHG